MSEQKKRGWKTTAKTHPRRVMIYENDDGVRLLEAIARRRECSIAAAMRQMIREEAARAGIRLGQEAEE